MSLKFLHEASARKLSRENVWIRVLFFMTLQDIVLISSLMTLYFLVNSQNCCYKVGMIRRFISFLLTLLCSAMTIAGAAILYVYGAQAIKYLMQGGPAILGALAMLCFALMGLIFMGVFGYMCSRVLTVKMCVIQTLIAISLAAWGFYLNDKQTAEDHYLWPNEPVELQEGKSVTLTNLSDEKQATLLFKDSKGEHKEEMTYQSHTFYQGIYIAYSGQFSMYKDLDSKRTSGIIIVASPQPGRVLLGGGVIGALGSLLYMLYLLIFRCRGCKDKSVDAQPQEGL